MKNKLIYKISFVLLPFLLAFPLHFLYDIITFPPFAIYLPINESIFQHTKLTFTGTIISYLIFYFIKKKNIDKTKYLSSLIISISISTITMLAFYYVFKAITNSEIMFFAIISLLLGIIIGQLIAIKSYKKGIKWSIEISIYALITTTFMFLILTLDPPFTSFFISKE